MDTWKSFCYFWALDMAPTWAGPGLYERFELIYSCTKNWIWIGYVGFETLDIFRLPVMLKMQEIVQQMHPKKPDTW